MIILGHVALSLLLLLHLVPTIVVNADPTFTEVHDSRGGAPRVGLYGLQACTASTTDDACMQNTDMVEALDADPYLFGKRLTCGAEGESTAAVDDYTARLYPHR